MSETLKWGLRCIIHLWSDAQRQHRNPYYHVKTILRWAPPLQERALRDIYHDYRKKQIPISPRLEMGICANLKCNLLIT